jgi:hypothetical protein
MMPRCRTISFTSTDSRCADKKRAIWEVRLASSDTSWLPLSENADVHPPKNEPLNREMHLKILYFISGLKISRAVEKLLFTHVWNIYPPISDSWYQVDSDRCIFILLCQH